MTQKLTKIIATIGPSSDSEEKIKEFIENGINVFRFNFKHSALEWHDERIQRVQKVAKELNKTVGILLDLQGPEIRLSMSSDEISLVENEEIILLENNKKVDQKGFSLSEPDILNVIADGQTILADDGLFVFVVKKENGTIKLISKSEGRLKNKKSINILGLDYDFPVIHDRDREGLNLAKKNQIDFIALSFVRNGKDIESLRTEMKQISLDAKIVAKIETEKALSNIDDIIEKTDLIMIARGDLGVEIPAEEVPFYQKMLIKKCMEKGIPVITATQMLESMTTKPIPTRAEVSDVANAVYDFTDAVMLSGETASGRYPLQAVKSMTSVVSFNEDKNRVNDIRNLVSFDLSHQYQMLSDSAFNLYKALKNKNENVNGFIIFTQSGKTVRMLSRYRPHAKIFAFCPNETTAKGLTTSFGVTPIIRKSLKEKTEIVKADIEDALKMLEKDDQIHKGDLLIIIHGDYWSSSEGASTIRLLKY